MLLIRVFIVKLVVTMAFGKTYTRYLLSHTRKNRQLPEIGFHSEARSSVAYNCHSILLFDLFPSPSLSLYFSTAFFLPLLPSILLHFFALSFISFRRFVSVVGFCLTMVTYIATDQEKGKGLRRHHITKLCQPK